MSSAKKPLSWHPKKVYPDAPSWEKLPPNASVAPGLWWMPFKGMVMAASVAKIINTTPIPFRGKRLSVAPHIAASFRILDIRVGPVSFSIDELGALGTLFPPLPDKLTAEERADYEALLTLDLPTASPAQRIEISVCNLASEDQAFDAVLWGICAP
jgi:hypothetical protein